MTSTDLERELETILHADMTPGQQAVLDARVRATTARAERTPKARMTPLRRARQTFVLVAATTALLLATALASFGALAERTPAGEAADRDAEERLRDDLAAHFGSERCYSFAEATELVQARLRALGIDGWAIEARGGAEHAQCVVEAPVGDIRTVLIMPGLGGPAARAMDELAATLMERCHRRDEAIALMASELDRLGVGNWSIRTDGPLAVPVGQQDAVREHIAAGCYVYSGNQASKSGDGGRVFFLAGP